MMFIDIEEEYVNDEIIREMFPERYNEIPSYGHKSYYRDMPKKIDTDLGLQIVEKPTIYDKYGITLDPNNSFHNSVQRFFDKNGFITDKQKACFD